MTSRYSREKIDAAIDAAVQTFGLESLKPQQREAIREFVSGRDVFVALPTGFGKSYCFALLPTVFDHLRAGKMPSIMVCVSPLTALMMEQRDKLCTRGLSAEFVGELQQDISANKGVESGHYQVVYISPEALLLNPQWREMLLSSTYRENLVAFVIDEAHCITKWGESFRPEYKRLGEVRALIPTDVNIMALTATASSATRSDIVATLCMDHPAVISASPHKKNIKYIVKEKSTPEELVKVISEALITLRTCMPRLVIFCKRYLECARMYSLFRYYLTDQFTEPPGSRDLAKNRIVDMYCKCTEASVKETIIQSFCDPKGTLRVVIATIAFGMGLDCPDVRQTILWGAPSDVEAMIQQTGRAGRDGYLSCALLMHCKGDRHLVSKSMQQFCQDSDKCRRHMLFCGFDNFEHIDKPCTPCRCCDVCAKTCCCGNCVMISDMFLLI